MQYSIQGLDPGIEKGYWWEVGEVQIKHVVNKKCNVITLLVLTHTMVIQSDNIRETW